MKHIELSKIVSKAIFEQGVYGLETAAHARMTIDNLLPASDIDDEIEDRKISKHVFTLLQEPAEVKGSVVIGFLQ